MLMDCVYVCHTFVPSVTLKYRILKFQMWIPYEKTADLYF